MINYIKWPKNKETIVYCQTITKHNPHNRSLLHRKDEMQYKVKKAKNTLCLELPGHTFTHSPLWKLSGQSVSSASTSHSLWRLQWPPGRNLKFYILKSPCILQALNSCADNMLLFSSLYICISCLYFNQLITPFDRAGSSRQKTGNLSSLCMPDLKQLT